MRNGIVIAAQECTLGRLKREAVLQQPTYTGRDPLEVAAVWLQDGRKLALATVIETWGSAPRPAGSQLVIDEEGRFEGSVSGGCVEASVITEAIEIIASGPSKMLQFGVADEIAWRAGLSCGGRISIFVEPVI